MKCISATILCLIGLSFQENGKYSEALVKIKFIIFLKSDVLPAVPLVVKNPYLNTWLFTKELAGTWTTFWNNDIKAMSGMVRVNNQTYEFMGSPISNKLMANQTTLKVTPTQSIFTFTAGPIELIANFFTHIDPTDLKRLSLPASYIALSARALDGGSHKIQVYIDISGEWTSGDLKEELLWDYNTIEPNIVNLNLKLKNPKVLQESNGI